ncbi:phosphoribosylamine--glycine ligase [Trichuris suis]|nr:phosphoribosylamine--glycine ligase [Trichuris suis]
MLHGWRKCRNDAACTRLQTFGAWRQRTQYRRNGSNLPISESTQVSIPHCPNVFPSFQLSKEEMKFVKKNIMLKVVQYTKQQGNTYKGVLYAGLMKTDSSIFVLEFNCRFGDPEAEVGGIWHFSKRASILHHQSCTYATSASSLRKMSALIVKAGIYHTLQSYYTYRNARCSLERLYRKNCNVRTQLRICTS